MNLKRATIGGLIAYAVIFIIASIILYGISQDILGISMVFIMPIVIFFVSKYYYFKKEKSAKWLKESFLVGLYWMILSVILDIIILVYGFGIGWDFFLKANWTMPVGYLEYIIFCIVGALINKK